MLYTMWKNLKTHYFFQSQPSLQWGTYITDLLWHDQDWYKDVLVVLRMPWWSTWTGKATSLGFDSGMFHLLIYSAAMMWEILCRSELIDRAFEVIPAEHHNWKWLVALELNGEHSKDATIKHYFDFPILEPFCIFLETLKKEFIRNLKSTQWILSKNSLRTWSCPCGSRTPLESFC